MQVCGGHKLLYDVEEPQWSKHLWAKASMQVFDKPRFAWVMEAVNTEPWRIKTTQYFKLSDMHMIEHTAQVPALYMQHALVAVASCTSVALVNRPDEQWTVNANAVYLGILQSLS